jgi:hypothetical protein
MIEVEIGQYWEDLTKEVGKIVDILPNGKARIKMSDRNMFNLVPESLVQYGRLMSKQEVIKWTLKNGEL